MNDLLQYYSSMLQIRRFEEALLDLFKSGELKGTTHSYCGQEAVAVGVCSQLDKTDWIASTHRGHGHCLAKGGSSRRLMAEIFGKAAGYCGGRGGSQHLIDLSIGFLGANGITGGGMPLALGAAFQEKYRQKPGISVAFIGDGASNQGTFHETLNMASIWNLPLIVVCENNYYAMYTPVEDTIKDGEIAHRASAYKIEGLLVDGNDVEKVVTIFKQAKNIVLTDKQPVLIEAKTYRTEGHSKSDQRIYRSREEESEWRGRCPIQRVRNRILDLGGEEKDLEEIEKIVTAEIHDAIEFARQTPNPELAVNELAACYKTVF